MRKRERGARVPPAGPHAGADLDRALAALADPTRRRVVDLLRERPRRAGELVAAFDVSAPAMSRHLRVLRRSGLVEGGAVEEDARVRLYRLRPAPFIALYAWLGRMDALWGGQLEAFAEHVARRGRGSRA
ncbi:MAG: ArsR/SmtB family transcription factor [Planctomycetota bacterium]